MELLTKKAVLSICRTRQVSLILVWVNTLILFSELVFTPLIV